MSIRKIKLPENAEVIEIFGNYDKRARYLQNKFGVKLSIIGNEIWIKGETKEGIETVERILGDLISVNKNGQLLDWREFEYMVDQHQISTENNEKFEGYYNTVKNSVAILNRIKPKTAGQKQYLDAIRNKDIVFSIGPAGTGKTYLAVAMAVDSLKSGNVQRIILTRPAVEAGEKLGFLPGTLTEKVDPYLRPLYDSLIDMIPIEKLSYFREQGIIEVVPLAYMRGRTLNNSFIILDEAQNTTYQQMKMFLTRIGFGSKTIVTGDITQIDLEKNESSGLVIIQKILKDIEEISFVYLNEHDVVRNRIVKRIIKAYDEFESEENINGGRKK
ncbi:MAG: PhoH family protein [Petrotogales bacterium]